LEAQAGHRSGNSQPHALGFVIPKKTSTNTHKQNIMITSANSYIPTRPSGLLKTLSALGCAFVVAASLPAYAGGGNVQPATAKPSGYSLTDMAQKIAYFSVSLNNPAAYPDTPFQILYISETNTFEVETGTQLFVPIAFITDSDPILGEFPVDARGSDDYFFDHAQLGGHDFEIEVDGKITSIGPKYVAGPVLAPGLADGGSHFIEIGAFLTPLSKGTHTVKIRATFDGDLLAPYFPGGIFAFEEVYTVIVR
jgi:hypothetical protein